jgi:hypothetical protein
MAIEVVHTPQGGQVGRDAKGRFTSLEVPNGKGVVAKGADFSNASQMSMDFGGGEGGMLAGVVPVIQEGNLVDTLIGIQSGIETLVEQTGESLGMNQQQLAFDFKKSKGDDADRRQKGLDKAETDKTKKKGDGLFGEGFLSSLKKAFGTVKEKFNIGDKLKLLLLATGLWALSKYSEQVIDVLAPMLGWFKKKFIPRMKKVGEWFTKEDKETGEIELDWTKIIGVGIGAWITKKLLGMTFAWGALKLGSAAKALLFGTGPAGKGGGSALTFRLLPLAAALAAFSAIGDGITGINWGDEVTGGKPVAAWKKGLVAALAGANNKEGSASAAIMQGLKWGAMGAYAGGLIGGPFGMLIGGTIGLLAGGIAGAFGTDKMLKIIDGQAAEFAEAAITAAFDKETHTAKSEKLATDQIKKEQAIINMPAMLSGKTELMKQVMDPKVFEDVYGHTKEFYMDTLPSEKKVIEGMLDQDLGHTSTGEKMDYQYDADVYAAIVAKKKEGIPLSDLEKEIEVYEKAVRDIDGEIRAMENEFKALSAGKTGDDLAELEAKYWTGAGGILELRGHLAEKSEMLGDTMQGWKDINAEQKKINLELENTLLQKSLENAVILNTDLNNQRAASGTQGVPIVVGGSTAVSKTDNFIADKSASNDDEVIKSHIMKLRFGT